MKKYAFLLLCVILMFFASACMSMDSRSDIPEATDEPQSKAKPADIMENSSANGQVLVAGWGPHMFTALFDSDDEKANQLLSNFCDSIENQNRDAIIQMFSPDIQSAIDIGTQLDTLFDYYAGSLCDYQNIGAYSPGGKDHYYFATYEVSTTEQKYRIAIKICYEDTADSGNVGIHSIYIIKAENADPVFAYWGGHVWDNGIIIEDVNNS